MSLDTNSAKKPKKIKESTFFLDFVRFTGCIPGLLWTRPKVYYVGDKKKCRPKKGVLIASNHVTFIDPIALYCVFWYRRIHFLATKDLYKTPFFGWMLTAVGCIQVDKDNFSMASLHETVDRLKAGKAILIFPEGQVNEQNETLTFKSGSVLMAKLANTPILPIHIVRPPKPLARYHVLIGEPVDISGALFVTCRIRPTVRHKPVGMIRRDKRRIRHYKGLLFNKRKRCGYPLYAAHPAGNICRRFRFTFSHQPHQEHFTVFGGHFHVGRFHQVAG